jgi:nucleotide-binding universal stress UspA family protein
MMTVTGTNTGDVYFYHLKFTVMKKLVVPVDFSATSLNAAAFAGNLAIFYGAEIYLYHAYEMPVGIGEVAWPLFTAKELQSAADHELEMLKAKVQQGLRSKVTFHTKAEMVPFTAGLTDFCEIIQPDMVVMGLSGKGALEKLIVGSNTIRVIHDLQYPVLVIPPKANFSPVVKIGFACDYKKIEDTTPVTLLKKVIMDFDADLYVLNVDHNDEHVDDEVMDGSIIAKSLFEDIKPVYDSIESESVTEGLNKYAAEKGLDWIVVIPKKHSLLQKIFSRSHSKDLLYHTHLPVLCVHQ